MGEESRKGIIYTYAVTANHSIGRLDKGRTYEVVSTEEFSPGVITINRGGEDEGTYRTDLFTPIQLDWYVKYRDGESVYEDACITEEKAKMWAKEQREQGYTDISWYNKTQYRVPTNIREYGEGNWYDILLDYYLFEEEGKPTVWIESASLEDAIQEYKGQVYRETWDEPWSQGKTKLHREPEYKVRVLAPHQVGNRKKYKPGGKERYRIGDVDGLYELQIGEE